MENDTNITVETNPYLESMKEGFAKGAATAVATVVVTQLVTLLIEKSVGAVRNRRNKIADKNTDQ